MRLALADEGVPPPVPQIEVLDDAGWFVARVDLGWEEVQVAAEYQGDHHRADREQWQRDQARFAALAAAGWLVLPCTALDLRFPHAFAVRVMAALAARAR
jgi:very-short-patch-repair endonuclease